MANGTIMMSTTRVMPSMANGMEKVPLNGKMEQYLKEHTSKVYEMDQEKK